MNTARGAIVDTDHLANALKEGHLRGIGGDVWHPQMPPKDHVLRFVEYVNGGGNAMVPHVSGTSLDAQARYASGVHSILQTYFTRKRDYRARDVVWQSRKN